MLCLYFSDENNILTDPNSNKNNMKTDKDKRSPPK